MERSHQRCRGSTRGKVGGAAARQDISKFFPDGYVQILRPSSRLAMRARQRSSLGCQRPGHMQSSENSRQWLSRTPRICPGGAAAWTLRISLSALGGAARPKRLAHWERCPQIPCLPPSPLPALSPRSSQNLKQARQIIPGICFNRDVPSIGISLL